MRDGAFDAQALERLRGVKSVGTCSTHIEGLHGRCNSATGAHRTILSRVAAVLHVLKEKAEHCAKNVVKGGRKIATQFVNSARDQHYSTTSICPGGNSSLLCDHGAIMRRRFRGEFEEGNKIWLYVSHMTLARQSELNNTGKQIAAQDRDGHQLLFHGQRCF
jgi:hypothetical protein